jgi:transcriptional repressor NrdR
MEEAPLVVVKRSGDREPFVREKIVAGMRSAAKNRPVTAEQLDELAVELEEAVRARGGEATSEEIGIAVLERLRELDEVAYLRFASVYKGFSDVGDFEREAGLLSDAGQAERAGDKARNPQG